MSHIEEDVLYTIYLVCLALLSITEMECCTYGFDTECEIAEQYVKSYEKDNPDVAAKYGGKCE